MKQGMLTVIAQQEIAPNIFELILQGELVKAMEKPGQFLHILVPQKDLLLRRPISINQFNRENLTCHLIYRVEGQGTKAFTQLLPGDKVDCLGPLGNGFDISALKAGDIAYIIGGGIGVPPLYELSRQLVKKGITPIHFLGFAKKEVVYYAEKFQALGESLFATDDGSFGMKGNVSHLLEERTKESPAAVFACGNNGMLKMVDAKYQNHPNAQISMEARMACGVGACYGCVCHVKNEPTKSVKVCDEGPIFKTGVIVL
ncbi:MULTISPECIES: dihydroorotate dehydrogenase electron transfer subunit [Enterococcus]|jgi:dihydroorotate dehydrogenase electron transfer subunit|uniref:Dihydroorotate dehydrogenase B (NAD(+)), electron transfer subunit n=1 Tax=Enterococcus dispar ATCC 51266 TaxID=1139219 RepID=S1NW15_9ENTE|nr:dihydroorotate dehydrogenase electron transfer subunit [Enterococcus dispar]EOT43448.1 dihydroorotate dehydrogenase, electron transfer subunit [Enterococcus dispar ATCC 51266]EOW85104.1 dihydroorotate dehydrogenase, electron transfer subunit [Enterococcus dispar ATCC 51266]MCU7358313.1 dihydroorotate dehydrogenase electron transfer subunit [Enterococcus dispar]MDT2706473.1 dihydroorotate dehydrogenase electron transfer subunit [Enterococcus dispar]OJG39996.1 dihydroorotate dehydrogenase, el